jgi:hypothetical protein
MSSLHERAFFHEGTREFQDDFDGRKVADAIERHRKHYSFWDDERSGYKARDALFDSRASRIVRTIVILTRREPRAKR